MLRRNTGFTLVELLLIVAIVGILASLAIAAYETYTARAQVSEGLALAAIATAPVVNAYKQSGMPPAGRLEAGLSVDAADTQGTYVSGIEIVNGRVDINFGNAAHPGIMTSTLSLTPYVAGDVIVWRCGHAVQPDGEIMAGGARAAEYQPGNIDRRYLPSSCR